MAILFTAPKSAIELVLVLDVVELSWTIERYSLSLKVLMRSCEQAIKQCFAGLIRSRLYPPPAGKPAAVQ